MATANTKKKKRKGKSRNVESEPEITTSSPSSDEKFTFFFRKQSPFSQWHPAAFKVDGVDFTSAEQFMMYQKAVLFDDKLIAQQILATDSPREHKALGRQVQNFDPISWNKNREAIVKRGNLAKFGQNPHLLEELKATKGTTLVEASPFDKIWGIGLSASNPKAANRHSWRGSNLLGEILTKVRDELTGTTNPGATNPGTTNSVTTASGTPAALEESMQTDVPPTIDSGIKPLPDPSAREKFTFFGEESPLSQWHTSSFTVDDIAFNSAMQYMMYNKAPILPSFHCDIVLFDDGETAKKILACNSPQELKELRRAVRNFDMDIWCDSRKVICIKGNTEKNPELVQTLLSTQGTTIAEASTDKVWGIGLDSDSGDAQCRDKWQGKNLLGQVLTEVRDTLLGRGNLVVPPEMEGSGDD